MQRIRAESTAAKGRIYTWQRMSAIIQSLIRFFGRKMLSAAIGITAASIPVFTPGSGTKRWMSAAALEYRKQACREQYG